MSLDVRNERMKIHVDECFSLIGLTDTNRLTDNQVMKNLASLGSGDVQSCSPLNPGESGEQERVEKTPIATW